MRAFYHLLINTLFASITNFFVWFAVVFWMYLETQSVLTTSISGGVFMIAMTLSGFWFGSIVDHNKKKTVKVASSLINLAFFVAAFAVYAFAPEGSFQAVSDPRLWLFVASWSQISGPSPSRPPSPSSFLPMPVIAPTAWSAWRWACPRWERV